MFAVFICLAGIFLILLVAEILFRNKIFQGEYERKFVHVLSALFIASWPWLVSFRAIQLLGVAMVAVILINRRLKLLHYLGGLRLSGYGDILLAIAVIACALLTSNKVFFAVAMVELALADGLAALVGNQFLGRWKYQVFGYTKTVIGSMVFWLSSLAVLGTGLLFAHSILSINHYILLLIVLPPILTLLENVAVFGLDNLVVPLAVVVALKLIT